MKIRYASAFLLTLAAMIAPALAHDLFLKLDSYFVKPNDKVSISVLNGSFSASEGAVTYARLADVSVISPDGTRSKVAEADFTKDEKIAYLNFTPTAEGTHVAGLSTMPREIELSGKDFNEYLAHDGIPDTLAERRRNKELTKPARERYSKHVKIIFQSGGSLTDTYQTELGYPVEIVPMDNPYSLKVGDTLRFRCLKDGRPLANQFVMTGYDRRPSTATATTKTAVRSQPSLRTDRDGVARVKLTAAGRWYVKFIQMTRLTGDPKLDYESKWASISFEVKR